MLLGVLTIFLACLGACIGSFLNVVVYRLPRGLSVSQPRRSFCPSCGRTIRWYDNIPILSWVSLRGRCRQCGVAISLQYPLVELCGVVVTMLVWHAGRGYCRDMPADACWPMIVGLLGLFYCLVALSAMDLEEYYVDIRLTWLALLIGLVCRAISPAEVWPATYYAAPEWGAFSVGCAAALVLLHYLWPLPREEFVETAADGAVEQPSGEAVSGAEGGRGAGKRLDGAIGLVVGLSLVTAGIVAAELVVAQPGIEWIPGVVPVAAGMVILFLAILAGSWLPTPADAAIAEAVESERSLAMREALREAAILAVCVGMGVGLGWLVGAGGAFEGAWLSALAWSPWEGVRPVAGLTTALMGWVIAGGACWAIRVVFTLALRKEALGFGDIHIIGAAGAVLGPHVAIAGFFLAAPVALAGTAVLMFRKNYRTLPFGPWLSIGFLIATLWGRPLVETLDAAMAGMSATFR